MRTAASMTPDDGHERAGPPAMVLDLSTSVGLLLRVATLGMKSDWPRAALDGGRTNDTNPSSHFSLANMRLGVVTAGSWTTTSLSLFFLDRYLPAGNDGSIQENPNGRAGVPEATTTTQNDRVWMLGLQVDDVNNYKATVLWTTMTMTMTTEGNNEAACCRPPVVVAYRKEAGRKR